MTNIERVSRAMSTGSPMKQAMIIQAIEQFVTKVVEQEDMLLADYQNMIDSGRFPLVHMPAWISAAKEIKQDLEL